ncbi:MAG TPA: type II toxin-antitoxin system VapC family toxin [Terriglobia bacterium]|nr:type II toxin-antitoxin system VapC family toxin [Terriglobia bacterium]
MTLVDTSVWVHHLRHGNAGLRSLLENGEVLGHPFIVGELACGAIANRNEVLDLLEALPIASIAEHDEVMHFLHEKRLYGRGLGWIDLHLLASASLSKASLWTTDRALRKAAEEQ